MCRQKSLLLFVEANLFLSVRQLKVVMLLYNIKLAAWIERDKEDMFELVRNCPTGFKKYYIQMQAAKRSQAPLPSLRDKENMVEFVRNCPTGFKKYYIQMQAAKRNQAPLPSLRDKEDMVEPVRNCPTGFKESTISKCKLQREAKHLFLHCLWRCM